MKTFIDKIKGISVGFIFLFTIFFTSCTDLGETPYTFINPESFYKTESDIDAALNNAYRTFRNMASNKSYMLKLEVLTDQGEPNYRKDNVEADNRWENVNSASRSFSGLWSDAYEVINCANIVLGRVDGIEMTETAKNNIKGQARFLRAYALFHLVRIYGACPIPLTYTSGVTGLEMARSSVEDIYIQITKDLEFGASNLPQKGDAGYDNWRVTAGACNALLGEAYLYKATLAAPEENNLSANKEDLQKSLTYSKKVIDSKKYTLISDYTQLWYWFNQSGAKNNAESIFELQYVEEAGGNNNMHLYFGMGKAPDGLCGMYCRYGAPGSFYNSYGINDRRRNVFLTDFIYSNKEYTYDIESERWNPEWVVEQVIYNVGNCKYYDKWANVSLGLPAANFPMLRYSEVLLNYAEAANLLSPGDGLAQLNEVHQRAGLTALPSMSQQAMDEAIIQERAWEFAGESKAYYDELRKGVLGDRTEKFVYNNHMLYKNSNGKEKHWFSLPLQFKAKKTFLWKIPQSDLDSNPALKQNPDNESSAITLK